MSTRVFSLFFLTFMIGVMPVIAGPSPLNASNPPPINGATVSGRVLDPSGAVIEGATVRLWQKTLGFERVATTDSSGSFRFDDLVHGNYRLRALGAGFTTAIEDFKLSIGEERSVELTLQPGLINEEVVVTATRSTESIVTIPNSVTVLSREQIETQTNLVSGLSDALGNLVPGLAPSSQATELQTQTLRGRTASILLDGIPQSTIRSNRELATTIDPSTVERIEVLRGPTAIYGAGGTGGVINIITKTPNDSGFHFTTTGGLSLSLTHPQASVGPGIRQSATGKLGSFDFFANVSLADTEGFFDAEGDRIPPLQSALADSVAINPFAKVGFNFYRQRLQLTIDWFRNRQYTDYTTDPAIDRLSGRHKARALKGLKVEKPQAANNDLFALDYSNEHFLGSRLYSQAFYRDYFLRFIPSDERAIAARGNSIIQAYLTSSKYGGRLDVETPLHNEQVAAVMWGLDFTREETVQPVLVMDPTVYDSSGGLEFRQIGERAFTPPIKQVNLGLFAQSELKVNAKWLLRGGLRHERVSVDINDFVTIQGRNIRGGKLYYRSTVFNGGIVLITSDRVNVFASLSQGFSVADIGRVLRTAPTGFSVESLRPEAQKVTNYEGGIRISSSSLQSTLSLFYNKSNLGASFAPDLTIVRAPEYIYGAELSVDLQPVGKWRFGGTGTWLEGKSDPRNDGRYIFLPGTRIPPLKLTAYVEHDTLPHWRNRLQILYSGTRRRFGNSSLSGLQPVNDYATLDWLSSITRGRSTLRLGIENLLNKQYFPLFSQLLMFNRDNTAARGAVFSLSYSISF